MGTKWAKSTFCGVEAESMFIKLDLVLPRGLSSLYPGGVTWVFRGVHTFVIKIKKYP